MDNADVLKKRFSAHPYLLAPMAGVTDAAYRIMCRRRGAAMAYSEMVSVAGLAYASEKTWDLVLPRDEEPQICVQLFGSKPEQFAGASRAVSERVGSKLDAIDINMACPARKVITKGEGSALLEQPELAEKIVAACVANCSVPVTVKIRKDFKSGKLLAPDFAARMEQAGASAVAVHGRSAGQLYSGSADWSVIDAVADRVSIPVIGTGDVFCAQDAANMLAQTAASAVFIARGTYGNPWIFQDAAALLDYGFAGWKATVPEAPALEPVPVARGMEPQVEPVLGEMPTLLLKAGEAGEVETAVTYEELTAPVTRGDVIGQVTCTVDGSVMAQVDITAGEDVAQVTFFGVLSHLVQALFTL